MNVHSFRLKISTIELSMNESHSKETLISYSKTPFPSVHLISYKRTNLSTLFLLCNIFVIFDTGFLKMVDSNTKYTLVIFMRIPEQ